MIEWVEASDAAVAEMAGVNQMVQQMTAAAPNLMEVGAAAARQARIDGESWMGPIEYVEHATDRTIETERGPLTVRTVVPDRVDAVYLHVHGGGWVLGAADQQDVLLAGLADAADVAVVSVEYRLAPEHPFPAGPDDCEAAAVWLIEHAADEFGTDRLLIGGESAGAHLSALTLLRLRERFGTVDPFVAANLVFGAFDLSFTPSAANWGDELLVLSTPVMEWFFDQFLPGTPSADRRAPEFSPLYADLAGLVPALFVVGDRDPLLDDSLFMGTRWRAAGNHAEIAVYPECAHGFIAFPAELSRAALARIAGFVRHHARDA